MGSPIYSDTLSERDDPARKQRARFSHVLRTTAGGPPTDNRRVQAEAVRGEVFLAIDKFAAAVQGTTAQITQRRANRQMRRAEKAFPRRNLKHVTKALPQPHAHADDEERRPVDDPDLRQLFDRPNRRQTLAAFLSMWRLQEMLTGNVIVWCNPDRHGRVREMFVLPTALCMWQPASPEYPCGAWRVHQPNYGLTYGQLAGSYALIPAHEVVHHKHLGHPLYHWDGLSPMTAASKWVDVLDAIDRSCWASMEGGVQRGTLVIVPGMSAEEADAQNEKIRQTKAGPDNARRPWVIGTNSPDSNPTVTDPDTAREMDFQTSRQNYASLVLALMGVPPTIAGVTEGGSYAADYAAMKRFRDWTLVPWLAGVASELSAGVLVTWDDGDDELKLQFDLPPFHNEEQDEARKSRLTSNGITTANMDRRAENMPPWDDPKADELPTTLFLKYLEQKHLPPPAPPPGQPGGDGGGPAPDGGAIDPATILSGLGGGPGAGNTPAPDNSDGEGSLPPQAKAFDPAAAWAKWVAKANAKAGSGRREGETWEKNGRYWTLKDGRTVSAPKPGGGGHRWPKSGGG